MPPEAGLRVDLSELKPFKKELSNLKTMLSGVDSVLDDLAKTITRTETSFTKGGFKKFLTELGNSAETKKAAKAIGQDIQEGIVEGMVEGSGQTNVLKKLYKSIRRGLNLRSPSPESIDIGRDIGKGIVQGISEGLEGIKSDPNLTKSIKHMSTLLAGSLSILNRSKGMNMKGLVRFAIEFGNFATVMAKALQIFNTIKDLGGIARVFQSLKELMNFLRDFSSMLGGDFGSRLKKFIRIRADLIIFGSVLKLLARSLSRLKDIPDPLNIHRIALSLFEIMQSFEILTKIGPSRGGFSGMIERFKFIGQLKVLIPAFKVLKKAMGQLSGLSFKTDPGQIAALLTSVAQIIDTFETFSKKIVKRGFGFADFFRLKLTDEFKKMIPAFRVIAKALNQFRKVKVPAGGFEGISSVLNSIIKLVDALSDPAVAKLARQGIGGGKGLGFIGKGNLAAIAKQMAIALNEFRKVKGGGDIKTATTALNQFVNALQRLQTIQSKGDITGLGDNMKRVMRDVTRGLDSSELRNNSKLAGIRIGRGVTEGAKQELEESSPSRVFMRIGRGIVDGLKSGLGNLLGLGRGQAANFVRGFRDGVQNMGRELRQAGGMAFRGGRNLLVGGGIAGLITGAGVNLAAEFDQTLKEIQIFGDLTEQELANVSNTILDFSAATIFAPRESADAFLDLQKAGLDASQAIVAIGDSGNLAAAGQTDLTTANNILIRTLQTFGLEVDEATRVTDGYLQAANLSTAGVSDLGDGMANVGPIAKEFGLSFEETVAVLSLFSDAGITGGEAGTQLRSMLTNLTRPTKQTEDMFASLGVSLADASGEFKGLTQISEEMSAAMAELTQEERFRVLRTLGGTFGQAGLSILLAEGGVDSFIDEMQQLPGAAEVANNMMDTFAGTLESFKGSVQTLIIKALTPLMNNVLRPMLQMGIRLVNWFAGLPSFVLTAASAFVFIGAAMATLLGVGLIIIGSILIPMGLAFSALSTVLTGVLFLLTNPIGLIAGAIGITFAFGTLIVIAGALTAAFAAITGGIALFINKIRGSSAAQEALNGLKEAVGSLFSSIGGLLGAVFDLVGAFFGAKQASEDTSDGLGGFISFIDKLTSKINTAANAIREFVDFARLLLDVNDQLSIEAGGPAGSQLVASGTLGGPTSRTVSAGESRALIANQLGISVEELERLNPDIAGRSLMPGERLSVPGAAGGGLPRGLIPDASQSDAVRQLEFDATQHVARNALTSRIQAFGQTGLGQQLFGDQATLDAFIIKVGALQTLFGNIKDFTGQIATGIAQIIGGDLGGGLSSISEGIANTINAGTIIFEQLTGLDISDKLQLMLETQDWLGIGAVFLNKLADGIGMAASAAAGLIGEALRGLLDKALQEAIGTDLQSVLITLDPLITSVKDSLSAMFTDIQTFTQSEQGQELVTLLERLGMVLAGILAAGLVVVIGLFTVAAAAVGPVLTMLGSLAGIINAIIEGDTDKLRENLGMLLVGIGSLPVEVLNSLIDFMSSIATMAGQPELAENIANVGTTISQLGFIIGFYVGPLIERMGRGLERLPELFAPLNGISFDGFKNALTDAANTVSGWGDTIVNSVRSAFKAIDDLIPNSLNLGISVRTPDFVLFEGTPVQQTISGTTIEVGGELNIGDLFPWAAGPASAGSIAAGAGGGTGALGIATPPVFTSGAEAMSALQGALGRAAGGPVQRGGLFEINEQRRGVPFEILNVGNRQFLLPGQNGFMQSPRGSGASGLSTGAIDQSQHVEVNIMGNTNLTQEQITSAVQKALEQDRIQRQPERALRLGGLS